MSGSDQQVLVAGVGMIPFTKPDQSAPYDEMAAAAIQLALGDAGLSFDSLEQAYAGYVYGDSCSGQRAIYRAGMSGIPIFNVNNNCSTGSTALFQRRGRLRAGRRFRANEARGDRQRLRGPCQPVRGLR
jgi:sterol carrier protein 2